MLHELRHWFSARRAGRGRTLAYPHLHDWAEQRQHTLRPARDDAGFVVEGKLASLPWRMEWGASQRPYIAGQEIRIRAELGLPAEVQALVLDRPLQASMEKSIFDQYVEGVQTRIDDQIPPEMRWLVMFQKLPGDQMRPLRDRFAAVGQPHGWLREWLGGPLGDALRVAPLLAGQPFVLMITRGRLTLRSAQSAPEAADLQQWLRIFEPAMREARRLASQGLEPAPPTTQPSLWVSTPPPTTADISPTGA